MNYYQRLLLEWSKETTKNHHHEDIATREVLGAYLFYLVNKSN